MTGIIGSGTGNPKSCAAVPIVFPTATLLSMPQHFLAMAGKCLALFDMVMVGEGDY
ncbi:hypothetical protein ACFLXZ_02280 [Chloroflexota bacterium]